MSNRTGKLPGPYQKGVECQTNIRSGSTTTVTFEGSQAECVQQRQFDASRGATQLTIRSLQNGNYELTSVFPWSIIYAGGDVSNTDPPINNHELEINASTPSVYNNEFLRTALTEDQILTVKEIVQDFERQVYKTDGTSTGREKAHAAIDAVIAGGAAVSAEVLFDAIAIRGCDAYVEEHSVYRRTIVISTPQQLQASFYGVGLIWTTAEVIAQEQPPSPFFFTLPTTVVWLKSRPRATQAAGQKMQIAYSYTEAPTASVLLYNKVSGAVANNGVWTPP